MDFDETRLYYSHQQLQSNNPNTSTSTNHLVLEDRQHHNDENDDPHQQSSNDIDDTQQGLSVPTAAMRRHFREFFRNYRLGHSGYIYRNRLLKMYHRQQQQQPSTTQRRASTSTTTGSNHASIQVDLAHIGEYDVSLLNYVRYHPVTTLPVLEAAASDALQTMIYSAAQRNSDGNGTSNIADMNDDDDASGNGDIRDSGPANKNTSDTVSIPIQVLLIGTNMKYTSLRNIQSQHINRLIHCPGIVISTSPVKYRATQLTIRCARCTDTQVIHANADENNSVGPFGSFKLPQRCMSSALANNHNNNNDENNAPAAAMNGMAECPMYPYTAIPDESKFIDQQVIKLQETPNHVPTGEMPRSVICTMECTLVDIAPPGTRISILCIPTLYTSNTSGRGKGNGGGSGSNNEQSKSVYLRVVGIQKENGTNAGGINGITFTPAEEDAFRTLARRPDVYDILHRSIAPNIHGSYTTDIKKALTCQLFSGCRKQIYKSSNMVQLRGDINVLLLGDPSMAKSQFLKFISQVAAPIGIYTSGKGSSAAGLTASVVRDAKGEFYLEGGAMVLADGGIVCIDEFDKMRPNDRVAIHEAMEQQTISIAKAGITTVLNSRTSVLAAANPVFGRYDDFKSAGENIDLMTTILSRFDMIFLVRDVREEERDRLICQHVMGVHIDHSSSRGSATNSGSTNYGGGNANGEENGNNDPFSSGTSSYDNSSEAVADHVSRIASTGFGELSVHAMKKYIQYCKMKCSPRLSEEAGDVLTSSYVRIRDEVRKQSIGSNSADSPNNVIPITVRQLEALVRISESLAKMRLDSEVRVEDVTEALRLFQVSTMTAANTSESHNSSSSAANNNSVASGGGLNNRDEIDRTESFVRSRFSLPSSSNSYMNRQKLVEECIGQGYNAMTVARVLYIMVGRGEIIEKNQGRLLKRVK